MGDLVIKAANEYLLTKSMDHNDEVAAFIAGAMWQKQQDESSTNMGERGAQG